MTQSFHKSHISQLFLSLFAKFATFETVLATQM